MTNMTQDPPGVAAAFEPHILILEDRAEDAELMIWALRSSGIRPTWVRAEDGPAGSREQNNTLTID